jgi:hypothetical protein
MEPNQTKSSGGIIGATIIVLVVAGLLIWLLPTKNDIPFEESRIQQNENMNTEDGLNSDSVDSAESIEADLNSFDSDNSDINFDNVEF